MRAVLIFFYGKTLGILMLLERTLAVKISIHFLFAPLYQERNVIGYILGFVFRLCRIVLGGILYVLIIIAASILYIIWALIPAFLVLKVVLGDVIKINISTF